MDTPYKEMSFEIDAIRSACIRAVPSIMDVEVDCPVISRPIRLADVLKASLENGSGPDWFEEYVIPLVDLWNLHDDDFEHQSKKFYEMAYILLK